MIRVAVIAQSEESGRRLAEPLERQGLDPIVVLAAEALAALRDTVPDAVLCDFSPAARDVIGGVLAEKDLAEQLPLLVALAPDDLDAYESGPPLDDFILWPALPREIAARVRTAVRRRHGDDPESLLRFGDLAIDVANYRVTLADRHVPLTFKEYELLRFLAINRDRVFTREALLNRVWGYDYFGGARTVDVHIRRLRVKIEDGHRTFIETIRNVGYRFHESG